MECVFIHWKADFYDQTKCQSVSVSIWLCFVRKNSKLCPYQFIVAKHVSTFDPGAAHHEQALCDLYVGRNQVRAFVLTLH